MFWAIVVVLVINLTMWFCEYAKYNEAKQKDNCKKADYIISVVSISLSTIISIVSVILTFINPLFIIAEILLFLFFKCIFLLIKIFL